MLHRSLVIVLLFVAILAQAQTIKVEYNKNTDFSHYKTFSFGEGVIITPKDLRQVPDSLLHKWVKQAIKSELAKKGLQRTDSAADLVVTYITGSEPRSDAGDFGPLGLTPGSTSSSYFRDYKQGSLVIDLNDRRNGNLIWRINSVTNTNVAADAERSIERTVGQGFKKFSIRPKKGKK
jgi:Domain of unknown function (DUF4136)